MLTTRLRLQAELLGKRGMGALDELELLGQLLGVPLAEETWFRYRGLRALLAASVEELVAFLAETPGVTTESAERLLALRELTERLRRPPREEGVEIDGSAAAYEQLAFLGSESQEVVVGMFLDARNRRLAVREI